MRMIHAALAVALLALSLGAWWVESSGLAAPEVPKPLRTFARPASQQMALGATPATPSAWCSLGESLEASQPELAAYCMGQAVKLGAGAPQVLMRVANYHFARGENPQAIELTSRVLGLAAQYNAIIFDSYRRLGISVADALEHGLPEEASARQAYFRSLLRRAELSDVTLAWEQGVRDSHPGDEIVGEYLRYLVRHRLYDKSAETWAAHLGDERGDYGVTDFVFNGSFDRKPSGVLLDWVIGEIDGVTCRLINDPSADNRALEIEFDGTRNVHFQHVSQLLPLKPGAYRLRLRIRTEQITTGSGIYVRLYDPDSPSRLDIRGREFAGTSPWTVVEAPIRVSAATGAVMLRLCRDPSIRIDNKIWGKAWVDDVSLVRAGDGS